MEEKKDEIIEQKPVSEEEFKEKIHKVAEANRRKLLDDFKKCTIHLRNFSGVGISMNAKRI